MGFQIEEHDQNNALQSNEEEVDNGVTKKGTKRKRKAYSKTPYERKQLLLQKQREKHCLKPPCILSCKQKCTEKISQALREVINRDFWNIYVAERKMFVLTSVERQNVKRRRGKGEEIKRNWSLKYSFKNLDGKNVSVCKHFFLATLGYKPNNDSFVFKLCSSIMDKNKNAIVSPIDKNNCTPWNKLNEQSLKSIKSHIDTFNPSVSHYRRAHAPNMRYLPNEVNANFMYEDFKNKFSDIRCSYDAYRKVLRDNNISFTKLGHEECEQCEEWKQHNANHSKDTLNVSSNNCNVCQKYEVHLELYTQARSLYESHKKELNSDSKLTVSVDLQKVIMLPRM